VLNGDFLFLLNSSSDGKFLHISMTKFVGTNC
jgi:hypothetical protein